MLVYGGLMVSQPSLFPKLCFEFTLLQWCQRMNTCFSNHSVFLFIKSNCDMFHYMPQTGCCSNKDLHFLGSRDSCP